MTRFALIPALTLILLTACSPAAAPTGTPSQTPTPSPTAKVSGTPTPSPTLKPTLTPSPTLTLAPTPARDTELDYSTIDRPDDTDLFQVHFIYAIPSDGVDRLRDVSGEIATSANAANYWLEQQTGGSKLRYDTYQGKLDISFMELPYSAEQIASLGKDIVNGFDQAIRDVGFDPRRKKIFFIYYDGAITFPGDDYTCGQALFPPNFWGVTGAIYLQGYSEKYDFDLCPPMTGTETQVGWLELVMLHETFHILGAVPKCGKNYDLGHVSDSNSDLMNLGFDGSAPPYNIVDFGNDDYFNHAIPYCTDIANSAFLEPLPENSKTPPDWIYSIGRRISNPLEDLEE